MREVTILVTIDVTKPMSLPELVERKMYLVNVFHLTGNIMFEQEFFYLRKNAESH